MFFAVFAKCIRQNLPPNPLFSGTWETEGDVSIFHDKIQLISDKPKAIGALWKTKALPSHEWSGNISLNFTSHALQSEVGIWLTQYFGVFGSCFGGPNPFKGLAILVVYESGNVRIEVRENDGTLNLPSYAFFPKFETVVESSVLNFYFDFNGYKLKIDVETDQNKTTIFDKIPKLNLQKRLFSITAQGFKPGYPIELLSAQFSYDNDLEPPRYPRSSFNKTRSIYQKVFQGKNVTTSEILDSIVECSNYAHTLESSSKLQSLIHHTFLQFSSAWQRRDLNMLENVGNISDVIHSTAESFSDTFDSLKKYIDKSIYKLNREVSQTNSSIFAGVQESIQKLNRISDSTQHFSTDFLLIISLIEIVILAIAALQYIKYMKY